MLLSEVKFGSLLSYTSHPASEDPDRLSAMNSARDITIAIKTEKMITLDKGRAVPMSEIIAEMTTSHFADLPFSDFFNDSVLVPIPGHSPMKSGSLWVPERIAQSLDKMGFGTSVVPCLVRTKPVNKSAFSKAEDRPLPITHYESLQVRKTLSKLDKVLLIDDVITRGSTFPGAASKIAEAYPNSRIYAFAAVRTITDPTEFTGLFSPVAGKLKLLISGQSHRSP